MFSTGTDDWQTPPSLFRALNDEFQFTVDVAANELNALCQHYFTEATDGLAQDWGSEICWCNPPYSKAKLWVTKAAHSASAGAVVVMLLPARTDTKMFHDFIWCESTHCPRTGVEVRFLRGRLKFQSGGNPVRPLTASVLEGRHAVNNSAPFPSMVVVFKANHK